MDYVTKSSLIFPMTYPLGEAYVRPSFPLMEERDLEIVCTLRVNNGDNTRGRVKTWVNEYAKQAGLDIKAGEVSFPSCPLLGSLHSLSVSLSLWTDQPRVTDHCGHGLFQSNVQSKDYCDSQPCWLGRRSVHTALLSVSLCLCLTLSPPRPDFRFMEAMSSGALVFVDHMHTPRSSPLRDDLHVVYFDNNNKTDLFTKLEFYRTDSRRSRSLAISGYLHVMKHHRAACLLDYIFRTVHAFEMKRAGEDPTLTYSETGFELREVAVARQQRFQKTSIVPPGIRHSRMLSVSHPHSLT
jgi:hypothetical protein